VGLYDLILMDYQMPIMDGPAAISAIRALGYKGVILGLTGNVLAVDQDVMVRAGAEAVLTKPLDIDILWNTLQRMLKN
jgi:CheY-like chemotaxis protein